MGAAGLGLANILGGLFSFVTGRDYWPSSLRRLRRRAPASPEDRRTYGLSLMLNGAAVMMVLLGVGMNIVASQARTVGEPENTLRFLLMLIGIGASLACIAGSYWLSRSVRYVYGNTAADLPQRPAP